jgi:3-oxoacyl-[acyl-carrier-protein] synthase II
MSESTTAADTGFATTAYRDARGRYRVAITGMGVTTPAGCDLPTFWNSMLDGRGLAGPITYFDAHDLPTRIACEVRAFDPLRYGSAKAVRRMDRFAQYALSAAVEALADAGDPAGDPARRGVVCGTSVGGIQTLSEQSIEHDKGGPSAVSHLMAPMVMTNAAGATIALQLGWQGPNTTVATACASGTTAIGEAARLIRHDECDVVLAGGTDACVIPILMASFCRLGSLSERNEEPSRASRPFDRHRDGYVMGEGGAFLFLERWDLAIARRARIYGEVVGYGQNCDAYHLTAPLADGGNAAACIRKALADAGLRPEEIGHVNAHGTATSLNDAMEARALHTVFPAGPPPVTASKGVFGHLLGAAGAAEAVVASLAVHHGVVPPVANCEDPDPGCDLDVVTGTARTVGRRPVLSNSFGFGGQNASLVIAPAPGTHGRPTGHAT